MRLYILGDCKYATHPNYRGTDRLWPSYSDEFPEEHEVNQAFLWFCRPGAQERLIDDLAKVRELVRAYKKWTGQHFDIVEITKGKEPPSVGKQFLGFDLSSSHNESLLSWGLEISGGRQRHPEDEMLRVLEPLLRLTEEFFKPKLNPNGLFEEYERAQFCLECMVALQRIHPQLFESHENFQVVGLYRLPIEEDSS